MMGDDDEDDRGSSVVRGGQGGTFVPGRRVEGAPK